ncbi:hypothetical protein J5N97_008476 [Dioscorea zingiberensis]|uniref:Uncharacterized protein n=1 Tax=Dioscorea zingiberensis TaxID=325984 RepID=A0A9D5HL27_9LILI|nr:hypothetical protein J5N97_008476 [Dioscorea zingiberensis]
MSSSSSSPPSSPRRRPVTAALWPDMVYGVLSDSKRVVAAHSRHFLALTVLFILPLSLLLLILFTPSLLPPSRSLLRSSSQFHLLSSILYPLAAVLLLLAATSSISASTHHGFFGRPVHLLPTLTSIPSPILRLILTLLFPSLLLFILLSLLSLSPSPLFHSLIYALALLLLIQSSFTWSLVPAIAVLECTWGFHPFRRSFHLLTGMRCAALILNLSFSLILGLILWGFNSGVGLNSGICSQAVRDIARTVLGSGVTTLLLLYWIVTSTVLYMYCKALYGELEAEILREFAWDYVFLPFDDQKVPRVVSVVTQL